jgi:hypothetical protein
MRPLGQIAPVGIVKFSADALADLLLLGGQIEVYNPLLTLLRLVLG